MFSFLKKIQGQKSGSVAVGENLHDTTFSAPVILWETDSAGSILFSEGNALSRLGFTPGQLVGQSVFELYKGDKKVIDLIRRGLAGEEFDAQVEVGGRIWDNYYIPRHDDRKEVSGLVVVSMDVTDRLRERETLEGSQERLRSVIAAAPVILWDIDTDGNILLSEGNALPQLNLEPGQRIGQSVYELYKSSPEALEFIRRGLAGEEFTAEVEVGGRYWHNSYIPRHDAKGNISGLIGVSVDVTQSKREELELARKNRILRVLSGINQALIHAADESAFLHKACEIVVEAGYSLAWIGFAEHNEEKDIRPVAHAGVDSGYVESLKLTWADAERGRGPSGIAIRSGKPSIAFDIAADPVMAPWRKSALERGYRSSIALPLIAEGGAFGIIAVYSAESGFFSDQEVGILEELASDLSFGILSLRSAAEHKALEERFKIIFDNTNDGILLADSENTKFTLGNTAICEMLGYTPEEITTLSIADIHPKESLPYVLDQFDRQVRGEISVAKDLPVKRKDGSIFYADVNTSEVTMRGRKYALGVFRDVTERRNLEIEREQYFKFFQISTEIMVIADPNGRFKKINPVCIQMLGYPEAELLEKSFIDFVHPDDRQPTLDEMKKQIASGSSLNFENRYVRKDGTVVWLSWSGSYEKMEGTTYATARNITDRKEAEEKEKEYTEGLENMNKLMVGRELKMIELKNEIAELQQELEQSK